MERSKRGGVRPRQLKVIGVKKLIANALQAQGLRGSLPLGKKRYEFQVSYGFRKYFKTHAQQVMQQSNVEKLMGHRSSYKKHQVGNLEWFEDGVMHRVVAINGKVGQIAISNDTNDSTLVVEIDFPDISSRPKIS